MLLKKLALGISTLLLVGTTYASPINYWGDNGFSQIGDDEGVTGKGYVDPGWGGQDFDAEYMFYKMDGNTLHVGIQTGFDVSDGHVLYKNKDYFAGDLALSFDGDTGNYEYAVDFGLFTEGYYNGSVDAGSGTGVDAAGLYSVSTWNNDIYFPVSSPFAMDEGSLVSYLSSNEEGLIGDSYYRTVSFDLSVLGLASDFDLDGHWTMSCGNDYINGHTTVEVPEPSTLPLFILGSLVAVYAQRRKRLLK